MAKVMQPQIVDKKAERDAVDARRRAKRDAENARLQEEKEARLLETARTHDCEGIVRALIDTGKIETAEKYLESKKQS